MTIKKYYNIAKNKLFPINRSLTGSGVRKTLGEQADKLNLAFQKMREF